MPLYLDWLNMSYGSQKSADVSAAIDERSSASRYYYAAYQAATAFLQYSEEPARNLGGERVENWSHESTPERLRQHLRKHIADRTKCNDLAARLRLLYKARVYADYQSGTEINRMTLAKLRREAGVVIHTVRQLTGAARREQA